MGDRSADDRDIDFALKVSQSAEFVSKLKDGTNTLIEEKSKKSVGRPKAASLHSKGNNGAPSDIDF